MIIQRIALNNKLIETTILYNTNSSQKQFNAKVHEYIYKSLKIWKVADNIDKNLKSKQKQLLDPQSELRASLMGEI